MLSFSRIKQLSDYKGINFTTMKLKKKSYLYFTIFLIFTVCAYIIRSNELRLPDYQDETNKFVKTIHEKEILLNTVLQRTINDLRTFKTDLANHDGEYFEEVNKRNEIAIIVSKNDSVVYWSTNSIPVEDIILDTLYISEIFHLSNGWYEVREKRYEDYLVRGAILIKKEYAYQNEYLVNEFQKDFALPADCEIQLMEGEYNVFSSEGYLLCSLQYKNVKAFSEIKEHLVFTSYILAYIFLFLFLIITFKDIFRKLKYKAVWAILFCLLIAGLRYLSFKFRLPGFVYNLDVFGPKYYANSDFIPSLGDLLLNVISIFMICLFLFRYFLRNQIIKPNIHFVIRITSSFGLMIAIPFLFSFAFNIIKGLIINSNLEFDLNNIFNIDFYSFTGLVTVFFILLSFFLLSFVLAEKVFILSKKKPGIYLIILALSWIGFGFVNFYYKYAEWSYLGVIFVLLICIVYYLKRDRHRITIQAIVVYVILFSLLSTYCFYKYNAYRENEKRKLLALKLSVEQDPIAEYLFDKEEVKIISDTTIKKILKEDAGNKETQIVKLLQKDYLNGYLSRYNLQVTICPPRQILTIQPDDIKCDCDTFFQGMINNSGIATMNPHLYFLNDGSGRNSYITMIPFDFNTDSVPDYNLYLEIDSKFFDREQGYPELLINKDIKIDKDLYNYSYAKYKDNKLIMQYGKYSYSMNASTYKHADEEYSFFEKDGFDHLFYKVDSSTGIVISKKRETALDIIAPFSYIFIFYTFFILIFLLVINFPIKIKEIYLNFKTRIQISMVSVLIASFIIIGVSTLYYITSLYDKKNVDNISEKAHSVLIEIENKVGSVSQVTPEMKDDIANLLTKFSNIFFTDINLYTPGGLLVASSRPQVFDEGMISRKMDSKAFNELTTNKKTLYIHEENIGNLIYQSAYVPFRNDDNNLIGYINLPYFAKQSELKKEISTFLIAFININIILTALAIIIALVVANYITRPMKLIKDKIRQIKLGRKNEKIAWQRNDEIGGLISDYNRMIDELAESAELLAKSERESAWREMAKQVAHEIKNPLTPMKLGIQYLQKSWKEKTPGWEMKFDKFAKTMIEQIESLSRIASEFSDFAKMPKANNENIDLVSLVENAMVLYQDNRQSITLTKTVQDPCFVVADKIQMLRVFNNLLKNSIQAISEVDNGKINIKIRRNDSKIIISVADNGVGISKEASVNIFSPNFTTKTGGMGLGLVMVKSIVESYEGKISFVSAKGEGTTFIVELPAAEVSE
jgi:two-component system, NtrC family, nitrogen regulation sensor histidine kinase NtrY